MIDYYAPELDLTLLGCGFLGTYHLGAIYLLGQIWPKKPYNRICGASCGGLLGALLIAGLKFELVLFNAMAIIRQLRCLLTNPIQLSSVPTVDELIEQSLEKLLPANAHKLCSNKLGVSLTKMAWSLENRFLSTFRSRRELIDAIRAGCFIPLWSGSLVGPKLEGCRFIDGAYSDNCPRFADHRAESQTAPGSCAAQSLPIVELSPFASQVEVSPKGEGYLFKARVLGTVYLANWNNVIRTLHAMIPFHLTKYKLYLLGGHRDMKDFLFRKNLIKCRQCYARQSEQQQTKCDTSTTFDNATAAGSACLACLLLLERVDNLQVSDELLKMLNE